MILTLLLFLLIGYLTKGLLTGITVSNPLDSSVKDESVVAGKFTPRSLAKYNGSDHPKIYIAVKGRVFDVSNGATFYGPGGPYENFAGRDASRGLAKNSFELNCLTPVDEPLDKLKDLSESEIESLQGWEEHFENKYPVVGTLHNESEISENDVTY